MTEQLTLTLIAVSVGFVGAIFLCIGSALNSAKNIKLQSTSFYGFNPHWVRALAAQRAQYVIGALLLLVSFALQIAAALASSTTPADLPQWIHTWHALVLAVIALTALIGLFLCLLIYKSIERLLLPEKL